jgi:hypothetical protein
MKMGENSGQVGFLLKGIYYALPHLSNFDIKGQVANGIAIEPIYFLYTTLYALAYGTILIGLASFIFKRRDLR